MEIHHVERGIEHMTNMSCDVICASDGLCSNNTLHITSPSCSGSIGSNGNPISSNENNTDLNDNKNINIFRYKFTNEFTLKILRIQSCGIVLFISEKSNPKL